MKKSSAIDNRYLDNEGKSKIFINIRIGRDFKKRIPLPVRAKPDNFVDGFVESKVPQARMINSVIKAELLKIETFEAEMYHKGMEITPELFINWLESGESQESFIHFYEEVLEKDKTLVRESTRDQNQTLDILKKFRPNIKFSTLNRRLVDEFHNFLIDQGYAEATIKKHHKNLKKYINKAIDYGKLEVTLDKHPYRGFKFSFVKNDREFLTEDELTRIEALPYTGTLKDVRDLFLFSCACGMRFDDTQTAIIELSETELKYTPRKTIKHTSKISVPVDAVNKNWLFTPLPKITNQEANRYLKNIMVDAEISKYLTFHVARHTFLTTVAKRTGSIFTVMKYGGLRKTDTAMIYVHLAGV